MYITKNVSLYFIIHNYKPIGKMQSGAKAM